MTQLDLRFEQVEQALTEVAATHRGPFVIAVPAPVNVGEAARLMDHPDVVGLVLPAECADAAAAAGVPAGRFVTGEYRWQLPPVPVRALLFLGPRSDLSFRMVREAMRSGAVTLVYAGTHRWIREFVAGFLVRRVYERLASDAQRVRIATLRAAGRAGFKLALRTPFRTAAKAQRLPLSNPQAYPRRLEGVLMRALSSAETPLLPPGAFEPERILLVNSSLAWGGAERQIVNTLCGLHDRGFNQAELLCEHIHDRPDHDFYLWHLERARVQVTQMVQRLPLGLPQEGSAQQALVTLFERYLKRLPPGFGGDIMRFAQEFLERRPGVVHAWQDSTSIRAGLAAALVGVPRIVLSGRNMAPHRFNYFLPYMAQGYRALATRSDVVLLNNSNAGAADYAAWLRLPRARFEVIHNGIRDDALVRPAEAETRAYRHELGIPDGVPVVGSIFRFYPEKDPLLWIETAARVASALPECRFLLVGTGVMEDEVRARARDLGLGDRLLMPGTNKTPARSLALMDVFLLTSRIEGTPNVVIEAQWLGIPVVATAAGGTADTIDDGRSGYVVRSRNPVELAARVMRLIQDQTHRREAQVNASTFVRDRFGIDRMVDATLDAYRLRRAQQQSA